MSLDRADCAGDYTVGHATPSQLPAVSGDVEHYDLVVVGSGPAGEKGSTQAAYHGRRVAIVEREDVVGGIPVRNAAIPTKTLRETALYVTGYHRRDVYGVSLHLDAEETFTRLRTRTSQVVESMAAAVARNLDRHAVVRYHGQARLGGDAAVHVEVDGQRRHTLRADVILLAPGSRPAHPAGIPFDDPDVHDTDRMIDLAHPFRSVVVLGGGATGCEYASIFAALGVDVVLVEARHRLIPFADAEVSAVLAASFQAHGTRVITGTTATVERRDGRLCVRLPDGEVMGPDKVLFAGGRRGNVEALGLEDAGVAVDRHNHIVVNEHFETTAPRIYAAGDIVGPPALGSVSMEQARVAMCHAFKIPLKPGVDTLPPVAIYSIPEVAAVGMNEEQAAGAGFDHSVGRAWFAANARATIAGQREGFLKLVFNRADLRLLGVHIVGDDAAELVHIGQVAMHHGATVEEFIHMTFNVPTRADAYKYAAYDGLTNAERST